MSALLPWLPLDLSAAAWCVFYAYWAIEARRAGRNVQRESALSRGATIALMVLAFGLLLETAGPEFAWWQGGPISLRLLAGVLLLLGGLGLAVWARRHLAAYWSGAVGLKAEHRLIQSGPYAWVRHPIYLGLLVAMVGTALLLGSGVLGWLGVALASAGFLRKLLQEEHVLEQRFGEAYRAYRRQVRAVLPWLL